MDTNCCGGGGELLWPFIVVPSDDEVPFLRIDFRLPPISGLIVVGENVIGDTTLLAAGESGPRVAGGLQMSIFFRGRGG